MKLGVYRDMTLEAEISLFCCYCYCVYQLTLLPKIGCLLDTFVCKNEVDCFLFDRSCSGIIDLLITELLGSRLTLAVGVRDVLSLVLVFLYGVICV